MRVISGYVEVIERGSVRGWAFDADDPARRLTVELLVDGWPVSKAPVAIERADLAALGIGRSDFAFDLRPSVDIALDVARMGVRIVGGERLLPLSDRACAIDGAVERVGIDVILGWAWHIAHPRERLMLEARLDGLPVATGRADIFRPDLLDANIGDGHYGFRMAVVLAPHQIAPGTLQIVEQKTGRVLNDLRAPHAAPRFVKPSIVAAPAQPVSSPAPATQASFPRPRPVAQPTASSPPPVAIRPAAAPAAPPPPRRAAGPPATAAPQPPASPPVPPQPAPPPAAVPPPARIRVEQEPQTILLSREAAEALRQAMGDGEEDSFF